MPCSRLITLIRTRNLGFGAVACAAVPRAAKRISRRRINCLRILRLARCSLRTGAPVAVALSPGAVPPRPPALRRVFSSPPSRLKPLIQQVPHPAAKCHLLLRTACGPGEEVGVGSPALGQGRNCPREPPPAPIPGLADRKAAPLYSASLVLIPRGTPPGRRSAVPGSRGLRRPGVAACARGFAFTGSPSSGRELHGYLLT